MFLYRSLTIGLLGAVLVLMARAPRPLAVMTYVPPPASHAPRAAPGDDLRVVDVAPGMRPDEVAGLVTLAPGERITAVDDRAVDDQLAAALTILAHADRTGHRFIDIAIAGGFAERRVLLLVHGNG